MVLKTVIFLFSLALFPLALAVGSQNAAFELPPGFNLKERYIPPQKNRSSRTTLIILEDIHRIPFFQKNMANAVAQILNQGNVGWVALEGAWGELPVATIKKQIPAEKISERQRISNYFFRRGDLSGTIYGGIELSSVTVPFFGVEDPQVYKENVAASATQNFEKWENLTLSPKDRQLVFLLQEKKLTPALWQTYRLRQEIIFSNISKPQKKQLVANAQFYLLAQKRDAILSDNILDLLRRQQAPIAIFVVGGFHVPGITRWLRQANQPYNVLTPNATGLNRQTLLSYLAPHHLSPPPLSLEAQIALASRFTLEDFKSFTEQRGLELIGIQKLHDTETIQLQSKDKTNYKLTIHYDDEGRIKDVKSSDLESWPPLLKDHLTKIRNEQLNNLKYFASENQVDDLEKLLKNRVSANLSEHLDHITALHYAAQQGHIQSAKKLLAYGANIDAVDWHKKTALMWAAERGEVNMVEFLLKMGADHFLKNDDGKTALGIAPPEQKNKIKTLISEIHKLHRKIADTEIDIYLYEVLKNLCMEYVSSKNPAHEEQESPTKLPAKPLNKIPDFLKKRIHPHPDQTFSTQA